MHGAQLVEPDVEEVADVQRVSARRADRGVRNPVASQSSRTRSSARARTATTARAADSLNSASNGSRSKGSATRAPVPYRSTPSTSACASPRSDTSWAPSSSRSAAAPTRTSASCRSASRSPAGGNPPNWPCSTVRPSAVTKPLTVMG
jgi:hypothetical protein